MIVGLITTEQQQYLPVMTVLGRNWQFWHQWCLTVIEEKLNYRKRILSWCYLWEWVAETRNIQYAALEAAKDYGIEYHVITLPVVVGQHESHITLRLMLWVQTAWTICFDNHKIFTSRRVWERETVNHQSKKKMEQSRSSTGSDVSVPFGLWRMALAGGCRLWRPLSWSLKGRHFSFLLCFV